MNARCATLSTTEDTGDTEDHPEVKFGYLETR